MRLEIDSPLPPWTVLQRLRERIDARQVAGKVTEERFRLTPLPVGRPAYMVECEGRVEPAAQGSRVRASVATSWQFAMGMVAAAAFVVVGAHGLVGAWRDGTLAASWGAAGDHVIPLVLGVVFLLFFSSRRTDERAALARCVREAAGVDAGAPG